MIECCEIKLIKLSLVELKKVRGLSFGRFYGGGDRGYAEFFEKHGGAVTALLRPYGNWEEVKCLMTEYDKVLRQAQVFDQLQNRSITLTSFKGKNDHREYREAESSLRNCIDEFRYHGGDIVSKIEKGELKTEMPAEAERETEPNKPNEPNDLITLLVAVKDYFVSRSTLKRAIESGNIESYRKPNAPKNSPHRISRKNIEQYYNKR